MSKLNYKVFEDNGGGLTLYVFGADEEILYAHTGYEYVIGDLSDCISQLNDNADAWKDWDNNLVDTMEYDYAEALGELENECICHISEVVADQDGLYREIMNIAARKEFEVED